MLPLHGLWQAEVVPSEAPNGLMYPVGRKPMMKLALARGLMQPVLLQPVLKFAFAGGLMQSTEVPTLATLPASVD